eukprot:gene27962-34571_t
MESEARRNLTLRSGSGGLPPALFEGVMTGVYTVAVTDGRSGASQRFADILRTVGLIGRRAAASQPAEQQPAEQQPAEQQPAEQQPAEQQPAEQQPAEQRGPVTSGVWLDRDPGTSRVDPAMDYLRELGIAIPQEMYGEQFLEMIRNRRQRAVDSNPPSVRIPREHLQPVTTVNSETETEAIISESESDAEMELNVDGSESDINVFLHDRNLF